MIKTRSVPPTVYDKFHYLNVVGGKAFFANGEVHSRFYEALEVADVREGMAVLDLGTGRGEMAVLAAQKGARVMAVDYSPQSLEIAAVFIKEKLKPEEWARVELKLMDANNLALADATFDRVFFLEAIEHLYPEEVERVLSEVRRVLKPGGRLILSTGPNVWLIKPLLWLGTLLTGRRLWKSRAYHVNEQSYFSLKKVLVRRGFSFAAKIGHSRDWLWGQLVDQEVSGWVKAAARAVNKVFDTPFFFWLRRRPLVELLLGTHFLCWGVKLLKGPTLERSDLTERQYDTLHRQEGFGEEEEYYKVIGLLLKGKKAVDIGCGYGGVEKYAPETVAVDFSEEALKVARQNGAKYTVKAAAENLPFQDNEFEVAVSLGVLEHCVDQEKAVREMVRVSEVQILAAHARLPYGLELVRKPVLRLFGLKDQPVEKPLTIEKIKRMLKEAGARVIIEGVWNYVDLRWLWKKIPYGLVKWPSHHFVLAIKTENQERRFLGRSG